MIRKLIKKFEFTDEDRDDVVLSDSTKVRQNTEDKGSMRIQLKKTNKKFPLDSDLYAKTINTLPNAVKKWLAVEIVGNKPTNTSYNIRLDNGVSEYYHNGSAWVAATTSDWNTEQEFNENISSFVFTDSTKNIRLVINLKTTDVTLTPYVTAVKLLGEYDIDFNYDLIYSTVVKSLKENLQYRTDLRFDVTDDVSEINLDCHYKIENTGYHIVDVESVYNLTTDPNKVTNLFSSYALGDVELDGFNKPGVVTLTTTIPIHNTVHIRLLAIPTIAVNTNQDYFDLKTTPAVTFETIEITEMFSDNILPEQESVKDKINGTATILATPTQNKYKFNYITSALLQSDLQNITESLVGYLNEQEFFTSYGMDVKYPITTGKLITQTQKANLNDMNASEGSFEVSSVLSYLKPSESVQLVNTLNLDVQLSD